MSMENLKSALATLRHDDPELAHAAAVEMDALIAALRPFAELARTFRDETGEFNKADDRPVFGVNDTHLTVGDMRAALKALE